MDQMIFDAHLHIIDPAFPLYSNDGYLPDPFTVEDYVGTTASLGIAGGAVVSGSFQCYDQTYLLAALDNLGPSFVGVTQLPNTISDGELLELANSRIRAVRFNIRRGGPEVVDNLREFACRVYDLLGWHAEVYADGKIIAELESQLSALPALSIDHLGMTKTGLPTLYRLLEKGVKVKASGFGRVDFAVSQVLRRLYESNPEAMMFGSDLPSTRSPRPFNHSDLEILQNALDEEGTRKVLWENAVNFYRLQV